MPKFPVDAPKSQVIKTLEKLGFRMVREGNHIAMLRENPDGYTYSTDNAQSQNNKRLHASDNSLSNRDISRRFSESV